MTEEARQRAREVRDEAERTKEGSAAKAGMRVCV
jgi:hypothetical protein